jgi:aspartate/methionine/tyrosine aminotransferase
MKMELRPSKRIEQVSEYYFSMKLAQVRSLQASGKEIINLGIGNPDIPPHPEVLKELAQASERSGSHTYQSYKGMPELRNAFCDWYKTTYKVELDAETEVLPLMGSKEGIMHISMAFCNAGDRVLVPNPGYPTYTSVSNLLNLDVQHYNLNEFSNWLPDINELEKLATENTKIIWINYPHMPTGAKANADSFIQLVEFARKRNILLVNDNPYSLVLNDDPLSLLAFDSTRKNVLELNSLSKSHNMAGWRVGLVAGHEQNIRYILQVKSNFDSGMFKPVQEAATKALQLSQDWFDGLNKIYKERRAMVWEMLEKLGCEFQKNAAGMFVWAKVPQSFSNGEEFSDFLLFEKEIFATPGSVFGSNGEKYIRFSLCAPENELEEAIRRIRLTKKLAV